jgi:hypothetical protein
MMMSYYKEVIQQQEYAHIIQEKVLECIIASLPRVGTEIDSIDDRIRRHMVISTFPEEMVVVPQPSLGGGLQSVSFRIKRMDISGLNDGSPRAAMRGDVGKSGASGWHCWLVWLVGEGRGDERNEQPVEARLLSNPPSPFHQAIKTLGSSRHSIGAPRTTLGSSRLHLGSTGNNFGLLWNLFRSSG